MTWTPQPLTPAQHLAKAATYADCAEDNVDHSNYDATNAYASLSRAHAAIAHVLIAREALAGAHEPIAAEPVPGGTLTRIHEALADDARPP